MAKSPKAKVNTNPATVVGQVVEVKNKAGQAVEMKDGAPDDTILRVYHCGKFGNIGVTDAEKRVLELVALHNHAKKDAYSSVYVGGKDLSTSASQWFRIIRRLDYMKFLQSQQIVEVSANISDFVKRISLLIKVTPYDLVNPNSGMKELHDLPEHVLSASKVSVTYDHLGMVKSTKLDLYSLTEVMNMIAQLEDIDPTLAKQFKTQLEQSKPTLKRSTPKVTTPKED